MFSLLFAAVLGATSALASSGLVDRFSNPQTCIVPSHGNVNISDTPAIEAAFKKCGKGGKIIFSENTTYALNELTTMTPCKKCTVELEGTLRMSDNITYWLKNATATTNITAATYPN
ncbi:hypothetical protein FS749_003335, partial [Ceratobasidium sp. UAMH 11750]